MSSAKWRPFCLGLNELKQPVGALSQETTPTIFWSRLSQLTCAEVCNVNTLRPRQDGRHFADDIFKYIFLNENVLISIKISLKFVPKGQINNIPALV